MILLWVPETVYKRDPAYNLDLGTEDHTFDTLEAQEKSSEGMQEIKANDQHVESTTARNRIAVNAVHTGADEKPYTFWEELRPFRGVESEENLFWIIVRPFGMLLFPQVLYGFITYGLSTSWLVVMISVLAQLFSAPPYNFTVSAIGLISIGPLIAALLGFVAGPLNDWTVKKLARWNKGIYEPEFRLSLNILTLIIGVVGFFGFGACLKNETPWIGPVFLYSLIWFAMSFLNIGSVFSSWSCVPLINRKSSVYGYITECHRNKAPEAFASINLRNIYSFGMCKHRDQQCLVMLNLTNHYHRHELLYFGLDIWVWSHGSIWNHWRLAYLHLSFDDSHVDLWQTLPQLHSTQSYLQEDLGELERIGGACPNANRTGDMTGFWKRLFLHVS